MKICKEIGLREFIETHTARQTELFPGLTEPTERQPVKRSKAHPCPIGSGAPGKTCRDCNKLVTIYRGGKKVFKCNLVQWTLSSETDIKLKDAACRRFGEG